MKKKNIISQFSEACTGDKFVRNGPGMLGNEVMPNAELSTKEVVEWLLQQEDIDNTLNLTGFSRGSVTCIVLANQLNKLQMDLQELKDKNRLTLDGEKVLERLKHLKINIFAIDPVAGMSDKAFLDRRVIPGNVKNYVAVVQMDEMRRDFKPQDMTRTIVASPNTKLSMLPMYGNHSDNTKTKNARMKSGAHLMWYSLYQFLTQHGTTFDGNNMPMMVRSNNKTGDNYLPMRPLEELPPEDQSKQLLKLFSQHHQEREAYLKSGKKTKLLDGLPVPRDKRSLNNHLDFYVKDSDIFVNQLERELFKLSYPKVFNYLFEKNTLDLHFPEDSCSEVSDVIYELVDLREENLELFTRLSGRGVSLDNDDNPIVGEPRGMYCIESCSTVRQIFPNILPESAQNLAPHIGDLDALEKEIYRLTFQYKREKSDLRIFSQRGQVRKAEALRNEIRTIIENQPGSAGVKYGQVLDQIEEHYKNLLKSRTSSQLSHMLGDLLEQHGRSYQVKQTSTSRVILAELIRHMFNLLKETIEFCFSFGYIGGGLLSIIGTGLQDVGRRCNDAIGEVGLNPLKGLVSAIACAFEIMGFALKHSFGIKPLGNIITSIICDIRDETVKAIHSIEVDSDQTDQKQDLEAEIIPEGESIGGHP